MAPATCSWWESGVVAFRSPNAWRRRLPISKVSRRRFLVAPTAQDGDLQRVDLGLEDHARALRVFNQSEVLSVVVGVVFLGVATSLRQGAGVCLVGVGVLLVRFAAALDDMLVASAAAVAAGAVIALLLVRSRDFVAEPLPAAAAATGPGVPAPQPGARER